MSLRSHLLNNLSLTFENNVFYQKGFAYSATFEKRYINLREKENRVYEDELVKELPEIPVTHPLKKEWSVRKLTLNKLVSHLKKRKTNDLILEVGCGNGWLAHQLAVSIHAEICGLDVNEKELVQGAAVFSKFQNLSFLYADIFTLPLKGIAFDTIILASSIQYFPIANELLKRLLNLLDQDGEIHIMDSPFYRSHEINDARTRTKYHFSAMGESEMAAYYFHRSWEELKEFNFSVAYNPQTILNSVCQKVVTLSPFPWIIIRK